MDGRAPLCLALLAALALLAPTRAQAPPLPPTAFQRLSAFVTGGGRAAPAGAGLEASTSGAIYQLPRDHALHSSNPLYKGSNDYMEWWVVGGRAGAAVRGCLLPSSC